MPDNEFYDSDEGEAQGAGGNLKSKHERNHKDDNDDAVETKEEVAESKEVAPMDVTMSQEEEEEIARALKESAEEAKEKNSVENAVSQAENAEVQQEDVEMTGIVCTTFNVKT